MPIDKHSQSNNGQLLNTLYKETLPKETKFVREFKANLKKRYNIRKKNKIKKVNIKNMNN